MLISQPMQAGVELTYFLCWSTAANLAQED